MGWNLTVPIGLLKGLLLCLDELELGVTDNFPTQKGAVAFLLDLWGLYGIQPILLSANCNIPSFCFVISEKNNNCSSCTIQIANSNDKSRGGNLKWLQILSRWQSRWSKGREHGFQSAPAAFHSWGCETLLSELLCSRETEFYSFSFCAKSLHVTVLAFPPQFYWDMIDIHQCISLRCVS